MSTLFHSYIPGHLAGFQGRAVCSVYVDGVRYEMPVSGGISYETGMTRRAHLRILTFWARNSTIKFSNDRLPNSWTVGTCF